MNILLVCSAGMSTSLLVTRMLDYAKENPNLRLYSFDQIVSENFQLSKISAKLKIKL